jgi:formylglycine-generating enzyme required for sulfatase activity
MEWMFAARGGDQTHNYIYSGSNNLDDVGWYDNNIDSYGTRPVGTKAANELGLYDLSGNVREWVWDIHGAYPSGSQNNPVGSSSGSSRVMRGGSWVDKADYCTVSFRGYGYADVGSHFMGFRVCKISP